MTSPLNAITNLCNLAWRKFLYSKTSSYLSIFTIILSSVVILIILISTSGVDNFIRDLSKDSLKNKYLASYQYFLNEDQGKFDSIINKIEKEKKTEKDRDKNVTNVDYGLASPIKFLIDGYENKAEDENTPLNQANSFSINTLPNFAITDLISPNYSFDDKNDETIPIILSDSSILIMNSVSQQKLANNKEVFKFLLSKKQELLGKDLTIYYNKTQETNTKKSTALNKEVLNFKFKVVGFGNFNPRGDTLPGGITIPQSAYKKFYNSLKVVSPTSLIVFNEYNSKSSRDIAVDKSLQLGNSSKSSQQLGGNTIESIVIPLNEDTKLLDIVPSRNEQINNAFDFIRYGLLFIGIFLMIISCMFLFSHIGKIIIDSYSEIGIIKAVGAGNWKIALYFSSYTTIIVTGGFVLGLGISYILAVILSLTVSENIFYSFAPLSTNSNLQYNPYLLVGTPTWEVLLTYFIFIFIMLLASLIPILKAIKINPITAIRSNQ